MGFTALKLVVGVDPKGWREDARRVRAMRDAVGDDIDLMIDANYLLNPVDAKMLCRAIEDANITWFEEPLHQNDARALADLRAHTRIPLTAGQMEGHRWRLRELVDRQAVDILQPNVCFCGGYTEAAKAGHLAQAFNLPIANGGGWPLFNMHTMAGLMNGWIVEWHFGMVQVGERLIADAPAPRGGIIEVPQRPGLGLTLPNVAAWRDVRDIGSEHGIVRQGRTPSCSKAHADSLRRSVYKNRRRCSRCARAYPSTRAGSW